MEEKGLHDKNSKLAVLNLAKENIKEKLSKDIFYLEYNEKTNVFNFSEDEILKNTNILCIVFNDEELLKNNKIKQLIDTAKNKDIDLYLLNTKEKPVSEIVNILNEISNMLIDNTLISIDSKELKGQDIIDAFVLENNEKINLVKEYETRFDKITCSVPNLSQVVLYVLGGKDTKLDDVFGLAEIVRSKLDNSVDIIFGCGVCETNESVNKIIVLFQGGGKKARKKKMLDEKIQKAHENFLKSDYMSIQTIEEEVHDKEFYKKSIEKFCELNEISFSTVQKYLRVGYPRAVKMIETWEQNGYTAKNGNVWKIENKNAIFENLKEFFSDKL